MDNFYIQMTIIIGVYSLGILTNLILLWSSGTQNQLLILPWLTFYLLAIFACLCSAPMIIIWFIWLQPEPIWALLSLAMLCIGFILMYFWFLVKSFFVWLCDEKKECAGQEE